MHCAILKALHDFQEKRVHKSRGKQFFFQNVQNEISRFSRCLKTTWNSPEQPAELTQKQTKTPHLQYSLFVTIVGYYYGVIIESL